MDEKERNESENKISESDNESSSYDNSINNSELSIHSLDSANKGGSIEASTNSDSDSSIDDGLKQSPDTKKTEKKRNLSSRTETDQDEGMMIEDETSDNSPTANRNDQQKVPSSDDLTMVQNLGGLTIEDITEDDEAWILQCPISLNTDDLENMKLVFGGSCDLTLQRKDREEHYDISSHTHVNKAFTCLLPCRETEYLEAKVLHPKGLIIIKERIDVPDFGNIVQHEQKKLILPSELKQRHPLFGSDYKQELEKRNATLRKKRKKKKKKRKRNISKTDDECKFLQKKKKRKIDNGDLPILGNYDQGALLSGNFEEGENKINMNDASEHFHKKKKKKSKNKDDFNEYESEIVHKQKKKCKVSEDERLGVDASEHFHKKKKCKNKDNFNEYENEIVHKKKKKCKVSKDERSGVDASEHFHKKKKRKNKDDFNGYENEIVHKKKFKVSEDERAGVEECKITHRKKKNKFKESKQGIEFLYDNEEMHNEDS